MPPEKPTRVSANRDPQHFADPDVFDLGRANARDHLSFAIGKHFCLGAALARLEGEIGLRLLLERLPGLRLDTAQPSSPRGMNSARLQCCRCNGRARRKDA